MRRGFELVARDMAALVMGLSNVGVGCGCGCLALHLEKVLVLKRERFRGQRRASGPIDKRRRDDRPRLKWFLHKRPNQRCVLHVQPRSRVD